MIHMTTANSSFNEIADDKFATCLRNISKQGISPYAAVNGEDIIDIPTQAIEGRANNGKTFSGYFDIKNEYIRIDSADALSFWLKIDFSKIPGLSAAPGGQTASDAEAHFESMVDQTNQPTQATQTNQAN